MKWLPRVPRCFRLRLVKWGPSGSREFRGESKATGGGRGGQWRKPQGWGQLWSGFKDNGPCPVDDEHTGIGKVKDVHKGEMALSQNMRSLKCQRKGRRGWNTWLGLPWLPTVTVWLLNPYNLIMGVLWFTLYSKKTLHTWKDLSQVTWQQAAEARNEVHLPSQPPQHTAHFHGGTATKRSSIAPEKVWDVEIGKQYLILIPGMRCF